MHTQQLPDVMRLPQSHSPYLDVESEGELTSPSLLQSVENGAPVRLHHGPRPRQKADGGRPDHERRHYLQQPAPPSMRTMKPPTGAGGTNRRELFDLRQDRRRKGNKRGFSTSSKFF